MDSEENIGGLGLLKRLYMKRMSISNPNAHLGVSKATTPRIRSGSLDISVHSLLDGISDDEGTDEPRLSPTTANKIKWQRFWTDKLSKNNSSGASLSDYDCNSNLSMSPPEIIISEEDGLDPPEGHCMDRRYKSVDYGALLASDNASFKAVISLLAFDGLKLDEGEHSKAKRASVQIQPPGTLIYEVASTDTLARIAAQHKSTLAQIKKINRLMSDLIFPGQMLFVPSEDYVEGREETRAPVNEFADVRLLKEQPRRFTSADYQPIKKIKKKNSTFIGEVKYVTDDESSVSGVLTISAREVMFEPHRGEDGANTDTTGDLVRYRMSLGRNIVAAWLTDAVHENEKNNESRRGSFLDGVYLLGKLDDDAMHLTDEKSKSKEQTKEKQKSDKKYLRVKLGIPKKAMDEKPTISKLLRESIPNRPMMEHYFQIQDQQVQELDKFLQKNYALVYNKKEKSTDCDSALIPLLCVHG